MKNVLLFTLLLWSVFVYADDPPAAPSNGSFRTMNDFDEYIKKYPKYCDPKFNEDYLGEYKHYIFRASLAFGIKSHTAFACLIFQESQFDSKPINKKSAAKGLGQQLPSNINYFHKTFINKKNLKRISKYDSMWTNYCDTCKKNGSRCDPCPPNDDNIQGQRLIPHLSVGYTAMNFIEYYDQLKLVFCGPKYKKSKDEDDCKINLKNHDNMAAFYSAVVVAYNRGIGVVIDTLRDKPINEWVGLLKDIKNYEPVRDPFTNKLKREYTTEIDDEARRHTISLQRCLLNEKARMKSKLTEVRESDAPYRIVNTKNGIAYCNDRDCTSTTRGPNTCSEVLEREREKGKEAKK